MTSADTILVTGGAGYIGSHTIIELLETTNYNVISIDNFSNSGPDAYNRIEMITGKKIRSYEADLCDSAATRKVFEKEKNIVGIIHFAAYMFVGESVENPGKYYRNNVNSLLNILDCAREAGVQNFIFSSSCSVYGNIDSLPVKETTPLGKAESPYAYTKQIGEQVLRDYTRAGTSLSAIALRYFNPVGAHMSGLTGDSSDHKPNNLVPVITSSAIGKRPPMTVFGNDYPTRDGTCIRDYIHVTDIAIAHIKALDHLLRHRNSAPFSVFNLGTGNGVSVLEIISAFERVSGRKLEYNMGPRRDGDVEAIYSDNSFTEKTLGWKPKFSLDDMMSSAWKWELEQQKK
jgi:UDP-glucose 4-epimerase